MNDSDSLRTLGRALLVLSALCSAGGCTGTETDNPVVDFDATACKSAPQAVASALSLPGTTASSASLSAVMAGDEYAGLFCVAWEASDDGELRVDLYNYRGGCAVEWAGSAARTGDGIELELEVVGCLSAACGGCTYDLSFRLHGVDDAAPLPLTITEQGCDGVPDEHVAALTLPLDDAPSGVRCELVGFQVTGLRPHCGLAHLPACAGEGLPPRTCVEGDTAACGEGLVCDTDSIDTGICLTACRDHADCPLEIERCEGGACILRETL